jgi:uncharacterized OsmC-like protein
MTTQTLNVINGVDTALLRRNIEAISADAGAGIAGFGVTTRWAGGTRTETEVASWQLGGQRHPRRFTIRTDEPQELLGTDTQPNPQEHLMAAFNSCMMVGYVVGASVHGVELQSLEIESHGELDLRGFLGLDEHVKPGYDTIHYVVRIKGNGTREQFQKIHDTVVKTSPNRWNVANPIRLTSELIVE